MRPLALTPFFLWIFLLSHAQTNTINKTSSLSQQAAIFDKYIQDAMPVWKVPGLSVAVVKDGKVIFKRAYGHIELDKPAAFDTSTISICASTTKAMTAVCIGMLIDEGKLKWDDKVADILPGFRI